MAKPDVKCGLSVVDRLARIRITSVAGLSVPSEDQPFVNEHETGGFYASMRETGYEPPADQITTIAKATAQARILACNLLGVRIDEARRAAQADLDQGELAFDGEDVEAHTEDIPGVEALPPGALECGASSAIDADFALEGAPIDTDPGEGETDPGDVGADVDAELAGVR